VSIELIKEQLPAIPSCSGIYQFFDEKEKVLYVGKAKNLRKRIASYTNKNSLSSRILRMVTLAKKVEVVRTASEMEALLLEHNLIKKLSPYFNILLKDDKAFAQIHLSNHEFPQISKYRGNKTNNGIYFGPFASTSDVNRTIEIIRKSFGLRSCTDFEFKSRTKPCLDYQIKKCLGPCVGKVSREEYQGATKEAVAVLSGKSALVQENFAKKMAELSQKLEYEKALIYRDKIKALQGISAKQNINFKRSSNFDLIVAVSIRNQVCIYASFYRLGQNYGARPYFFELDENQEIHEIISSFLGQFYLNSIPPSLIFLSHEIDEIKIMEEFLQNSVNSDLESVNQNFSKRILVPKKGEKLALIRDHQQIALQILEQKISNHLGNRQLLSEVKKIFDLPKIPLRIEVYDNSHTSGENAVGALIAAGVDGFIKSGYRKFNIRFEPVQNSSKKSIADQAEFIPRDDASMLRQVLFRRFSSTGNSMKKLLLPDLVLIDGGKGQLSTAIQVFEELNLKLPLVCMSKGEKRNAGEEWFHMPRKESFTLEKNSPVMHYLQRLRDEAHRFAITTHRKRRAKAVFKI